MIEIIKDAIIIGGVAVLRSVLGWAKIALQDGVITKFEYRKLAQTVMSVGSISLAGYFGLSFAGIDIPVVSAALAGFLFDKMFSK